MDKLRVGIVGVGSVVREIYQHLYFHSDYTEMLDIVAVADPNEEYRNWFCDTYGIPANRRFESHTEMFKTVELDAAQINTPDHLHCDPTIDALATGLDVIVPKPTAATAADAHRMIQAAQQAGRFMGIDFHKRQDPRIKEAQARYQSGRYGELQSAVWYMLDKLLVVDPNHDPMFFATPDFAERNTCVSFLTVHMCDALLTITGLKPLEVRATGFSQKLPSLTPRAVKGYDMVDTEVRLDNGAVAHIITGWHLPNTAHALTVQSSRMLCTDGMIDLALDASGYHELHADGIAEVNPLFRTFERSGLVTGYGMDCPGRLYQRLREHRSGTLAADRYADLMSPTSLGFYTALVLEAAEQSLKDGAATDAGVTTGPAIDLTALARQTLGSDANDYGY